MKLYILVLVNYFILSEQHADNFQYTTIPGITCDHPVVCLTQNTFTFCSVMEGIPVFLSRSFECPPGYQCTTNGTEPCVEALITSSDIIEGTVDQNLFKVESFPPTTSQINVDDEEFGSGYLISTNLEEVQLIDGSDNNMDDEITEKTYDTTVSDLNEILTETFTIGFVELSTSNPDVKQNIRTTVSTTFYDKSSINDEKVEDTTNNIINKVDGQYDLKLHIGELEESTLKDIFYDSITLGDVSEPSFLGETPQEVFNYDDSKIIEEGYEIFKETASESEEKNVIEKPNVTTKYGNEILTESSLNIAATYPFEYLNNTTNENDLHDITYKETPISTVNQMNTIYLETTTEKITDLKVTPTRNKDNSSLFSVDYSEYSEPDFYNSDMTTEVDVYNEEVTSDVMLPGIMNNKILLTDNLEDYNEAEASTTPEYSITDNIEEDSSEYSASDISDENVNSEIVNDANTTKSFNKDVFTSSTDVYPILSTLDSYKYSETYISSEELTSGILNDIDSSEYNETAISSEEVTTEFLKDTSTTKSFIIKDKAASTTPVAPILSTLDSSQYSETDISSEEVTSDTLKDADSSEYSEIAISSEEVTTESLKDTSTTKSFINNDKAASATTVATILSTLDYSQYSETDISSEQVTSDTLKNADSSEYSEIAISSEEVTTESLKDTSTTKSFVIKDGVANTTNVSPILSTLEPSEYSENDISSEEVTSELLKDTSTTKSFIIYDKAASTTTVAPILSTLDSSQYIKTDISSEEVTYDTLKDADYSECSETAMSSESLKYKSITKSFVLTDEAASTTKVAPFLSTLYSSEYSETNISSEQVISDTLKDTDSSEYSEIAIYSEEVTTESLKDTSTTKNFVIKDEDASTTNEALILSTLDSSEYSETDIFSEEVTSDTLKAADSSEYSETDTPSEEVTSEFLKDTSTTTTTTTSDVYPILSTLDSFEYSGTGEKVTSGTQKDTSTAKNSINKDEYASSTYVYPILSTLSSLKYSSEEFTSGIPKDTSTTESFIIKDDTYDDDYYYYYYDGTSETTTNDLNSEQVKFNVTKENISQILDQYIAILTSTTRDPNMFSKPNTSEKIGTMTLPVAFSLPIQEIPTTPVVPIITITENSTIPYLKTTEAANKTITDAPTESLNTTESPNASALTKFLCPCLMNTSETINHLFNTTSSMQITTELTNILFRSTTFHTTEITTKKPDSSVKSARVRPECNSLSIGKYPGEKCYAFYECINVMWWYQIIDRTCSSGLAFNPETKNCEPDKSCR